MTDDSETSIEQQVAEALAAGQKIQAIKIYRDATGKGLKDAKEFIDALIPRLIDEDPERYAALSNAGAGCGTTAGLLLFAVAVTALMSIA
ncbi:MAG: hypothetical protein GY903_34305 [Fuerstiella sp.]|nr:hypothetical protein [Fuerstiella sp.]MCP4859565.1 hypothetical protein [Fuerstiella sp.]